MTEPIKSTLSGDAGAFLQTGLASSISEGGKGKGVSARVCNHVVPSGTTAQHLYYCIGATMFRTESDGGGHSTEAGQEFFNKTKQDRLMLQFARLSRIGSLVSENNYYLGFGDNEDFTTLEMGKDLFSLGGSHHFNDHSGFGISGRIFLGQFVANNVDPEGDKVVPLLNIHLGIDVRLFFDSETEQQTTEKITGYDTTFALAALGHTFLQNKLQASALTSPATESQEYAEELFGGGGISSPSLEDAGLFQGLGLLGSALQHNHLLALGQKADSGQRTLLQVGQLGVGVGYLALSDDDAGISMLTQGLATLMNLGADLKDAHLLLRLLVGAAAFGVGSFAADEGEPKGMALSQAGFQMLLATVLKPELDKSYKAKESAVIGTVLLNEDGSRQMGGGTQTQLENNLFTEWTMAVQNVPISRDADPILDELANRDPLTEGAKVSLTTAIGKFSDTNPIRSSAALRGSLHFGTEPVPVPAIGAQAGLSLKLGELPVRIGAQIFGEYDLKDFQKWNEPRKGIGLFIAFE